MIELIDDEGPSGSEAGVSSVDRSWSGILGVGVLLAVAVLAWALTRPSADEGPGPDEAVIEQGVGDTPATTLIVPTSRPVATSPTTQLPGQQVLGEPTGLWLFFGGDANLQRLDLDTGYVDVFGLRAHPLLVVGAELVIGHNNTGSVGWVSLIDPGEQPNGWKEARISRGVLAGHLWTYEESVWTRFDLADNTVLEQFAANAPVPLAAGTEGRSATLIPGPRLISTPNGIFEATDAGEHVKVATGRLLTFDDERALVEQCVDTLTQCEMVWLKRGSWERLDLPVPETGAQFAEILGGGRYLHTVDSTGIRHQVLPLEVAQGQDAGAAFRLDTDAGSLTISNDGRWMAIGPNPDGVVDLVDLSTGDVVVSYPGFRAASGGSLLLADQAAALVLDD